MTELALTGSKIDLALDNDLHVGTTAKTASFMFFLLFYIVYTIMSLILLLNLLIAMMGDRFGTIMADAVLQYRVNYARRVLRLELQAHRPPLSQLYLCVAVSSRLVQAWRLVAGASTPRDPQATAPTTPSCRRHVSSHHVSSPAFLLLPSRGAAHVHGTRPFPTHVANAHVGGVPRRVGYLNSCNRCPLSP